MWVALPTPEFTNPGVVVLSPDGRRLAWAVEGGVIMVADLEPLRQEITAFERESSTADVNQPRHQAQKRRFSGPVRSDHGERLSGGDRKPQVRKNLAAAPGAGQVGR